MSRSFYSVYLVLLMPIFCIGQKQAFPLSEWQDKLSVKKDICAIKLNEVFDAIADQDSVARCEALALLKTTSRKNPRSDIRLRIIEGKFATQFPYCLKDVSPLSMLESNLLKCYEIEDYLLATEVHMLLSHLHYNRQDLGLAAMHQIIAKELMEQEGVDNFQGYAFSLYWLGNILYQTRDYEESAAVNKQALQYKSTGSCNLSDTLDRYWQMNTWNHLGLCYEKLGLYDSAFYAFNKASALAVNPFWQGLIQGNRGDVFFLQGKYDSAEALLKYDYAQSRAAGEVNNAALTLQRLARITHSRGDFNRALIMIREADALERMSPKPEYRVPILYTYGLIFKDLGMADSSFAYMEHYKALNESVEKHASENKIEITRLRLANEENIHEILALRKDQNRIRLIRNFSIALILVLGTTGYLYINRMRLKSRLKQQEAVDRMKRAEIEATYAKEQLEVFTHNLREKTGLIESLQDRLVHKEMNEEQLQRITELTHHVILTDEDWERFKLLFEKVHPGFFLNLKKKYSDITLAELRMAALCKLQLTSKEAASLLGISPNSVHKTRYRLKQRLGLQPEEELETYFAKAEVG